MLAEAASERRAQIVDHYEARAAALSIEKTKSMHATPYKAIEPDLLYLDTPELITGLDGRNAIRLTPAVSRTRKRRAPGDRAWDRHRGPRWAADAEADKSADGARANLFDKLVAHVGSKRAEGRKILITAWTEGSLDRLLQVTEEQRAQACRGGSTAMPNSTSSSRGRPAAAVLAIEGGFEIDDSRRHRRAGCARRPAGPQGKNASGAARTTSPRCPGSTKARYVVHAEHGIGQFHRPCAPSRPQARPMPAWSCFYAGDAKLFLPVENIELLTRYGSDSAEVQLDRLGGVAWPIAQGKTEEAAASTWPPA